MAGSGFSKTLNEIDINATLSAPFVSASLSDAIVNAVFYSPPNTLGNDRSDPSGGSWKETSCELGSSGPMNFLSML